MSPRKPLAIATLALAALLPSVALGQGGPGSAPPPPGGPTVTRETSVTFAPILLAGAKDVRVLELLGEHRLQPGVSVAAIAAYGKATTQPTAVGPVDVTIIELGGQGRYYVLGDFRHGLNIGLDATYIHGSASQNTISAVATGLRVAGFAGYKFIASFGLTVDIHFGYGYFLISGRATDSSSGATAGNSSKDKAPLLRLNLGYSF